MNPWSQVTSNILKFSFSFVIPQTNKDTSLFNAAYNIEDD